LIMKAHVWSAVDLAWFARFLRKTAVFARPGSDNAIENVPGLLVGSESTCTDVITFPDRYAPLLFPVFRLMTLQISAQQC
jgi:hypothetical protein